MSDSIKGFGKYDEENNVEAFQKTLKPMVSIFILKIFISSELLVKALIKELNIPYSQTYV